ncbi:MAG: DUF6178 family protein [Bdellovibrionota bacterium]|nr:DUF6178 family protein [Bdellovibrionota bacterium]
MNKSKDLIFRIVQEAKSYDRLEDIEKLVEGQTSLAVIPVQPLYVAITSAGSDQVAEVLPRMSKPQRQAMLDLDLWKKDEVDYNSFDFWIESYAKVKEPEIIEDFVSAEDFALYLRSRVNVYTFDVEDPEYPDHDFYFLTDDSLLLIEYGEDYPNPNELKYLIRHLYDKMGVEKAYAHLFKIVNDSHLELEEAQYQAKKERLKDYGFVDYFDAMESLVDFPSYPAMDRFINERKAVTAEVSKLSQNQSLHHSAVTGFNEDQDILMDELAKVEDEKRQAYLHFTFVRLVNSAITLKDALKGGRIELNRVSKSTRMYLNLGLEYIRTKREGSLFDDFDFFDVFRVGRTLISLEQRKLKKNLRIHQFDTDENEGFLGTWWGSFVDQSLSEYPKVKNFGAALHAQEVKNLSIYYFWKSLNKQLVDSLPFAGEFFKVFTKLKEDGHLHNDFYLNYDIEQIDFEAIILSSFVSFTLNQNLDESTMNKMGITISEFKQFLEILFKRTQEEYFLLNFEDQKMQESIISFNTKYGLGKIEGFDKYIYGLLTEHLAGYNFDELEDEEYKHIGGPIFLNTLVKN